jgi:hypothetical protein
MNASPEMELSQRRQRRAKTGTATWGKFFRRRRMNDPLLVFNMATFNGDDGWTRIFNPLKIHENGT